MNNIDKFNKIKELHKLKSEYHREELVGLVTFNKGKKDLPLNVQNVLAAGKHSYGLYQLISSFINKKQQ